MQYIFRGVWADRLFYFLTANYCLVAMLLALHLTDLERFFPLIYLRESLLFVATSVIFYIGFSAFFNGNPLSAFRLLIIQFFQERASGFILFACITIFNGTFVSVKVMMPELAPFSFDPILADIDEKIHLGAPWKALQFLNPHTVTIRIFYTPVWLMIVFISVFIACVSQPGALRTQFILTYMFCWIVLGNVLALAFMSAGPIYYEQIVGHTRYAGLTSHLRTVNSAEDPLSQIPDMLWKAYVTKTPGAATGISAFPSLHLSMATLFVLVSFRLRQWLGWAMTLYLFIIMAGSVHLGWHYAIDGYFSVVATIFIWLAAGSDFVSRIFSSKISILIWSTFKRKANDAA